MGEPQPVFKELLVAYRNFVKQELGRLPVEEQVTLALSADAHCVCCQRPRGMSWGIFCDDHAATWERIFKDFQSEWVGKF